MKTGIRVLGIDDSPFERHHQDSLVVGVVCRKNSIEGVLSTRVSVDGDDSTEKLISMLMKSRFLKQVKAIMLNSIMLAGFNAVDIGKLNKETGIPVIALTRKRPDQKSAERALENVPNKEKKKRIMVSSGTAERIGNWYVRSTGINLNETREIVAIFGNDPIRLAHVIASGIVTGESHGKS